MGLTKKLLPLLLVVAGIAALACGDGGDTAAVDQAVQKEVAPEVAAVQEDVTPERTGTVAESEPITEPLSGGTFRRIWGDPPSLDPALMTDTTSAGVVVEIFSGLMALDTDLQLVPDVAESFDISEDGLVYTFYLRPSAKFHDGKQVTAQDFKWSIERAANPRTASPVADTYLGDIVGVQDVIDGNATEISGIKVIDDYTLQFTIDAPKAYFLAKLTYPTAYVVDRENVESGGRNWADTPNGTGPFRLKEYRIGERLILERNEHYYRDLAKVDAIVMNLAGGQSMAMYENDEIEITGVSLFDLERILDPNEPLNKELVIAPPEFSVSYVGFNTNMPPFDSSKLRQALNHAIDKELIAKEVLSEMVVPAYSILPPGMPGYNPDLEGLKYDPDLAQKLLSESPYADYLSQVHEDSPHYDSAQRYLSQSPYAGTGDTPRIDITVPGTGGTIGLDLEVVLVMWEQVLGVQVNIQQVEWATYLQDLNKQGFQAYAGLGWEADYPDPQDFLDILFHTDSSINHGGYSNPEADAVLEAARVEQDVARRLELYRQAEEMIVMDAAWVPLWFQGERHVLIKSYVKDYRMTPMIVPKLKQVRIEG